MLVVVFPLAVLTVILLVVALAAYGHQIGCRTLQQLTPAQLRHRCRTAGHIYGDPDGNGSRWVAAGRCVRHAVARWMLCDEEE